MTSTGKSTAAHEAKADTEKLEHASPFRWLVRAGFVARAVTYGVIAGLAAALAIGAGTDGVAPNQQGALALLASTAAGRVALVVIASGLLAYAIWKLTQAIFGHGPEGGGSPKAWDRVANFGGSLVYIVFFLVSLRVLTGSAGNSSRETERATAGVLGWPGGPVLVAIGGIALIGISAFQIYDGLSGHFAHESKTGRMSRNERHAFMLLGRIGIIARALAFALVGYFVLKTAITFDPKQRVGLDGTLARLHHQILGPELVGLVAAGLFIFAAFSLLEGRYRRL